jgi:hypothetical protein
MIVIPIKINKELDTSIALTTSYVAFATKIKVRTKIPIPSAFFKPDVPVNHHSNQSFRPLVSASSSFLMASLASV